MNQFNSIGEDLQSEILKYNPSYLRVKKNLNKNLFYNHYCNQDITVKEFLSYIRDEEPSQYIIFTYAKNFTFMQYIYKDDYVNVKTLSIDKNEDFSLDSDDADESDDDEYRLDMHYTLKKMRPGKLLTMITYDEIYYDLKTTFNILSRRNCEMISPQYNIKKTLSIFNQHIRDFKSINLYNYFDLCANLIYYANNYDILSNQLPRLALHRSGIDEISFNQEGEVIEGDLDIIEDMIDEYNFKDEIIQMIMNL